MNAHFDLATMVYVGASTVFLLVLLYWFFYTRRLKTPRNVGTNEGIAVATQRKEQEGRSGTIG